MRFLLLILYLSPSWAAFADLRPPDIRLHLTAVADTFGNDEVIQLNLVFTNTSTQYYNILLPGAMDSSRSLLRLVYYQRIDGVFQQVYQEPVEIEPVSEYRTTPYIKHLRPADSVSYPIFINDRWNYQVHMEATHELGSGDSGEVYITAHYYPWDSYYAKYCFVDQGMQNDPQVIGDHLLGIPTTGLNSNFAIIHLSQKKKRASPPSSACALCKAVNDGKWDKVKGLIDKRSSGPFNDTTGFDAWLGSHPCVAHVGHGPDAILLSLPTYYSRNVIFIENGRYRYMRLTWQLGCISTFKSRLYNFLSLFVFDPNIRTSDHEYVELISLTPY